MLKTHRVNRLGFIWLKLVFGLFEVSHLVKKPLYLIEYTITTQKYFLVETKKPLSAIAQGLIFYPVKMNIIRLPQSLLRKFLHRQL